MRQQSFILDKLRAAGDRGICLADLPLDVSYTSRNRIASLRASGLDIRGERCTVHSHDGPVFRYRLVTAPVQMAML